MEEYKLEIGSTYNRLTIISEPFYKDKRWWIQCQCSCKNKTIFNIRIYSLVKQNTKSCGCIQKEYAINSHITHNLRTHKLYGIWSGIKKRCYNKKCKSYKDYGHRGIKICEEWLNDFKIFYDWSINNGWKEGLEIDRKNNDGDYEPNNCRFVKRIKNANNKRNNRYITIFNETKTMSEWSRDSRCKVSYGVLSLRINRNKWDYEKAITQNLYDKK